MNKDLYVKILLIIYLVFFVILAIDPRYRLIWAYESLLSAILVIGLILTYKKFKFSYLSYTLIFVYLIFHTIGSHYTYSEMPLFDLIKNDFGFQRNNYDRVVHFLFGFSFYFALYDIINKNIKGIKNFWKYLLAFLIIVSLNGIYEIIEYLSLVVTQSNLVEGNFLGMQGDVWDAQRDIIAGMIGALVSWIILIFKKKF